MGTRSRIGIELPDHSVVSVYCHLDGYVEHNGKILAEHYLNREDVQELIDGGSMSSLRTRETWNDNDREPQPLYDAERGDGEEPMHSDFDTFVAGNSCEEFAYLYDLNGNWKAYKIGWDKKPAKELEMPVAVPV